MNALNRTVLIPRFPSLRWHFTGFSLILYLLLLVTGTRASLFPKSAWWLALINHNIRPAHCIRCRYDLRGSPGPRCPECGRRFIRRYTQPLDKPAT